MPLPSHRELKLQARRDLHRGLQVPAYLYVAGRTNRIKVVNVRPQTEWGQIGDVAGTSLIYAERQDTKKSRVVFLVEEHTPRNGDVVMISPEEGWKVDNVEPVYNVTQAAQVVRLAEKELALYKAPPALVVYSAMEGFLPLGSGEETLVFMNLDGILPEA
jgi:hypothetical protein